MPKSCFIKIVNILFDKQKRITRSLNICCNRTIILYSSAKVSFDNHEKRKFFLYFPLFQKKSTKTQFSSSLNSNLTLLPCFYGDIFLKRKKKKIKSFFCFLHMFSTFCYFFVTEIGGK